MVLSPNIYHGVMGFSDILHQGMRCLRIDGAQNCTRYLFQKSSFPATAQAAMKYISLPSSCFMASLAMRKQSRNILDYSQIFLGLGTA